MCFCRIGYRVIVDRARSEIILIIHAMLLWQNKLVVIIAPTTEIRAASISTKDCWLISGTGLFCSVLLCSVEGLCDDDVLFCARQQRGHKTKCFMRACILHYCSFVRLLACSLTRLRLLYCFYVPLYHSLSWCEQWTSLSQTYVLCYFKLSYFVIWNKGKIHFYYIYDLWYFLFLSDFL